MPEFARPELVMEPATVSPPDRVRMPVELAWRVTLPVPPIAPEMVKAEPDVTMDLPPLPTVTAPERVTALAAFVCVRVRFATEKGLASVSAVVEVPSKLTFGKESAVEGRVSAPVPVRLMVKPPV